MRKWIIHSLGILSLSLVLVIIISYPILANYKNGEILYILVGETKILDVIGLVKVAIGDPDIADVKVISESELLINGKGEGTTSLILWTKESRITIEVEVRTKEIRDEILSREIFNLISRESVIVRVLGEAVVLEGELPDDLEIQRALKLAESYSPGKVINLLSTSSKPYQIEMEVRIAEVDRSFVKELGLEETEGILSYGIVNHIENIEGRLNAMAEEGRARLLAKPNLVTLSGHEASFLVGGEIPIPIREDMGITMQWKEYGVRLTIKPVAEKRRDKEYVLSTVGTMVSTLDWTNGVKVEGQMMPALKTRNVNTTLEIADGETLILAGLIQNYESSNVSKIPFLGDIPIIGLLFKSVEFNESQTELVIFMTPYIIK